VYLTTLNVVSLQTVSCFILCCDMFLAVWSLRLHLSLLSVTT